MAYSVISVLQKASQLLGYQYTIESEEDATGKKLKSTLQQAVDEVLMTADWLFAKRLIVLPTDANEENKQYGYSYSFKLPNDMQRQIAVYPFYFKKGSTGGATTMGQASLVGINLYNINKSVSFGDGITIYDNIFQQNNNIFYKTERIGNNLYANYKELLLLYISNDIQNLFFETNEYWFIELIAYKLAIINSFTQSNSTTVDYLERKYNIKLKNAINENERIKDLNKNSQKLQIYPHFNDDKITY